MSSTTPITPLDFCVEASTLKNLRRISNPIGEPIRACEVVEVMHLIELLVLGARVVYGGMSAPHIREQTLGWIEDFHRGARPKDQPIDVVEPPNSVCEKEAVQAANEFFSTYDDDPAALVMSYGIDINRATPTKLPFDLKLWQDWLKLARSGKDPAEWLLETCYTADGSFNDGVAVFYGASHSAAAIRVLLEVHDRRPALFEDSAFLRLLNVKYRLHFNLNLSAARGPGDDQNRLFMYAPALERARLLREENTCTFSALVRRVARLLGRKRSNGLPELSVPEDIRNHWRVNCSLPSISTLVLAEHVKSSKHKSLNEIILEVRAREDVKNIRANLQRALTASGADLPPAITRLQESSRQFEEELAARLKHTPSWDDDNKLSALLRGALAIVVDVAGEHCLNVPLPFADLMNLAYEGWQAFAPLDVFRKRYGYLPVGLWDTQRYTALGCLIEETFKVQDPK